ncbi:MAG TPA: TIGR02281 family clan AA aspartic protease [Stellaceae bacterium]|nr:TIGR02281 family clan AA aspartic protease [Stellaceae bacterium]
MLSWALRTVLLWGCIAYAGYYGWENRAMLLADAERAMAPAPSSAPASPSTAAVVANSMTFRAGPGGHVTLDAAVNGTPVRFLVDTGASLVTLTAEDAAAVGLAGGDLHFSERVATANGTVQMARVKLREIRLGQLTMEDVDAMVVDAPQRLRMSLLGMSFLKRLEGYEMRDGALTISW